ncbi:hypothetical protein AN958_03198 [Leucoagaricus sp. SymC.cos]|nr:hypothetical protein AN958_03198 [Leucoagaricus sp. SymC.cos]
MPVTTAFDDTICRRILRYIPLHRRTDLFALLTTCKSFHSLVEPLVYSHIIFTDVRRIRLFMNTLTTSEAGARLGMMIKTFGINLNELRARTPVYVPVVLRREFWESVRVGLGFMKALESFVLVQTPGLRIGFSWILDEGEMPFALKEVKMQMTFDNHVARFLNRQSEKGRLRAVQVSNASATRSLALDPSSGEQQQEVVVEEEEVKLNGVEVLDISLSVTPYIDVWTLGSLTNLQLVVDLPMNNAGAETIVATIAHLLISHWSSTPPPLRGLSIIDLPPSFSSTLLSSLTGTTSSTTASYAVHQLSRLSETLHHISHLHLPKPYPSRSESRLRFYNDLMSFRGLRSIELLLNSWEDPTTTTTTTLGYGGGAHANGGGGLLTPPSPAAQKALVSELRVYCPSLRIVVLWVGKMRFRWVYVVERDMVEMKMLRSCEVPEWVEQEEEQHEAGDQRGVGAMDGGVEGGRGESEVPRIENAVVPGEWHYRMEANQWNGYSTLWSTC